MVCIDSGALILAALLILVLPLPWLAAALVAAAVHELFHLGAVWLLGGRVGHVHIGAAAAVMDASNLEPGASLLAILAGPVGSIVLFALCRSFPKVAICAGAQGLFNLLPIFPLDGGRMLETGLQMLCPEKGEKLALWIQRITLAVITAAALWASIALHLGIGPLIFAEVWICKAISRKKP